MIQAIIQKEHYLTTIKSSTNQLVADESIANGGEAKGFDPMELLAASLAACTSITLRMYSDRKQWDVGIIKVFVDIQKDEKISDTTNFERKIKFSAILTNEQQEKLLDIANRCPVHRLLNSNISINTVVS